MVWGEMGYVVTESTRERIIRDEFLATRRGGSSEGYVCLLICKRI